MYATDLTALEIDREIAAAWYRYAESKRHNWHDMAATAMGDMNRLLDQRLLLTQCPPGAHHGGVITPP